MKKEEFGNHPRLPKGFGTIRWLGEGRANPYAVHIYREAADGGRGKALCYVPDWFTGLAVLAAWHAGQYTPRLPAILGEKFRMESSADVRDDFCRYLFRCFRAGGSISGAGSCTLREAYGQFYESEYGEHAARERSASAADHAGWAFKKLEPLADRQLDAITADELQDLVNAIGLKQSAVSQVITLVRQVYRYALARELCGKNPAQYLRMPDVPPSQHHQDFTDEELRILWENREAPIIRMVLVMCYSGFRWSAWLEMETNLQEKFFRGGIKTEAGKNRIVPIHSAILPLVEETLREDGGYHCGLSQSRFIKHMAAKLREIGIDKDDRHHTPHSCRHTFSRLCESYGVRDADRKRMMGHSFGKDITNGVYGHRTLEELRAEIEKIQPPFT